MAKQGTSLRASSCAMIGAVLLVTLSLASAERTPTEYEYADCVKECTSVTSGNGLCMEDTAVNKFFCAVFQPCGDSRPNSQPGVTGRSNNTYIFVPLRVLTTIPANKAPKYKGPVGFMGSNIQALADSDSCVQSLAGKLPGYGDGVQWDETKRALTNAAGAAYKVYKVNVSSVSMNDRIAGVRYRWFTPFSGYTRMPYNTAMLVCKREGALPFSKTLFEAIPVTMKAFIGWVTHYNPTSRDFLSTAPYSYNTWVDVCSESEQCLIYKNSVPRLGTGPFTQGFFGAEKSDLNPIVCYRQL